MMPISLHMPPAVGQLDEHHVVLDALDANAASCILRAHDTAPSCQLRCRAGIGRRQVARFAERRFEYMCAWVCSGAGCGRRGLVQERF